MCSFPQKKGATSQAPHRIIDTLLYLIVIIRKAMKLSASVPKPILLKHNKPKLSQTRHFRLDSNYDCLTLLLGGILAILCFLSALPAILGNYFKIIHNWWPQKTKRQNRLLYFDVRVVSLGAVEVIYNSEHLSVAGRMSHKCARSGARQRAGSQAKSSQHDITSCPLLLHIVKIDSELKTASLNGLKHSHNYKGHMANLWHQQIAWNCQAWEWINLYAEMST